MATATDTAPPARLKTRYLQEIRPALMGRFGYASIMQAPRIEKVTVNMGVGMAKQDSKVLRAATEQLATITGQQPSVRRARKSIAAFKLREGNPVASPSPFEVSAATSSSTGSSPSPYPASATSAA